jgi:ribosomal protein S8E
MAAERRQIEERRKERGERERKIRKKKKRKRKREEEKKIHQASTGARLCQDKKSLPQAIPEASLFLGALYNAPNKKTVALWVLLVTGVRGACLR